MITLCNHKECDKILSCYRYTHQPRLPYNSYISEPEACVNSGYAFYIEDTDKNK